MGVQPTLVVEANKNISHLPLTLGFDPATSQRSDEGEHTARFKLVLDTSDPRVEEAVIARLRSGEYVSFYVKPGFHSLGISEPTLTVPFAKGEKYYFLIGADYSKFGFEIQRIGNEKGERWLTKAKPVE